MPRYHFNIRSEDDFIRDEEGVEYEDETSAKEHAELGARDVLAAAVKRGDVIDGQSFVVTDDRGDLVFTYPFRDAVRLS